MFLGGGRYGCPELSGFEADGKDKGEGVFGERELRGGGEGGAVGGVDELKGEIAVHRGKRL